RLNHPAYASIAGALIYLASVIILIFVVIAGCEQWIHSPPSAVVFIRCASWVISVILYPPD
ncbi:hypothetical protein RAF34_28885, partial [Klebsiella pneumoniae]